VEFGGCCADCGFVGDIMAVAQAAMNIKIESTARTGGSVHAIFITRFSSNTVPGQKFLTAIFPTPHNHHQHHNFDAS
jgi:hypothetical protein